jgi:hypothetical protein
MVMRQIVLGGAAVATAFISSGCELTATAPDQAVATSESLAPVVSSEITAGNISGSSGGAVELFDGVVLKSENPDWVLRAESATVRESESMELVDFSLSFKGHTIMASRGTLDLGAHTFSAEGASVQISLGED